MRNGAPPDEGAPAATGEECSPTSAPTVVDGNDTVVDPVEQEANWYNWWQEANEDMEMENYEEEDGIEEVAEEAHCGESSWGNPGC